MQVIYARQPWPESWTGSIFLAGPTPRRPEVPSWRPRALELLRAAGYGGAVLVPEDEQGGMHGDYREQVAWEWAGLDRADCILFWIPRELTDMPAFTTNVEFGHWVARSCLVLGSPDGAPKMRYLQELAQSHWVTPVKTLEEAVERALQAVGKGAPRQGGECCLPLRIWSSPAFRQWYAALLEAGNRLDGARVEWIFRSRHYPDLAVLWALRVKVWVAAEQRYKQSEVVLGRPDVVAVALYHPAEDPLETEVVLVREFRSAVSNAQGQVLELPGGSSFEAAEPVQVAVSEVQEETGFCLEAHRLVDHGCRQCLATLSSHRGRLFSARLSRAEMDWFLARRGQLGGLPGHSEQTYLEISTLRQLLTHSQADWMTLGMLAQLLHHVDHPVDALLQ